MGQVTQCGRAVGTGEVEDFVCRRNAGTLTAQQQTSYLARVLERSSDPGGIPVQQLQKLFTVLLLAGCDVSSLLGWAMIHLALHPHARRHAVCCAVECRWPPRLKRRWAEPYCALRKASCFGARGRAGRRWGARGSAEPRHAALLAGVRT